MGYKGVIMNKPFIYGSVCSGIEAATVAWHPLGWRPAFFAEIDRFPSSVLAHRFPEIPNRGDFTQIGADAGPVDLLVGGTPCQSFSVAGLRGGMDDTRGVLALEFLRLARRLRPRWLVWENVPGVLSSNGGRDFGAFLGGLAELGYRCAWRVLDAQHFGVPQRRRRVFVVGYLGDWRPPAAVLFERESMSGRPAPRREAGESVAGNVAKSLRGRSNHSHREDSDNMIAMSLNAHPGGRYDLESETLITHTLRGEGFDASEDGSGRGTPLVPMAFNWQTGGKGMLGYGDKPTALQSCQTPAVAYQFQERGRNKARNLEWQEGLSYSLRAIDGGGCGDWFRVSTQQAVRRLTPRECERLQGFPGNWTLVPYRGKLAADGPRYKAIGNSMAVPVMAWIGRRIKEFISS